MIKIMPENIPIAKESTDAQGNKVIRLYDKVKPFYIPEELFKGRRTVTGEELVKWLSGRVFPRNRVDADQLLKKLSLPEYDPWKIAEKTKAALVTDPFWLKFDEQDTFEESTVRGKFGYPPLKREDVYEN